MSSSWWSFLLYFGIVILTVVLLTCLLLAFRSVIGSLLRPSRSTASPSNDALKLRPDNFWVGMSVVSLLLLAALPSATIFLVNSTGGTFKFSSSVHSAGTPNAPTWAFSKTVDVGGLATAAAALGAATAYIIDLVRRRIVERRGRSRNAQAKVVIEVLQRHWEDGASEKEIFRVLSSSDNDAAEIRRLHGAERLDTDEATYRKLESQLLGLVYERLIRISAPDHYKLIDAPDSRWDIASARKEQLRAALKNDLTEAIWDQLKEHPPAYEMARLLDALDSLDDRLSAEKLLELKDTYPPDRQPEALKGIVDFLAR
jgi:hypothetical protein